jgi:DNA-binding transcriptional regulator YiaG
MPFFSQPTSMMTPEQSRAARAWLGWSQGKLAKRANVSLSTVHDFERGQRTPTANNLGSMRRAIEAEGIRLLFDDSGAAAGIARQGARISQFILPTDY